MLDKAVLELLDIDMTTPLEIVTDGQSLVVSPARNPGGRERIKRALDKVNADHRKTLDRLVD